MHRRSLSRRLVRAILFANQPNCRDGRQHYRASLRDAPAPFACARQHRGKSYAQRHFAPTCSVVSVAVMDRFVFTMV
jgi:hypothetical protein